MNTPPSTPAAPVAETPTPQWAVDAASEIATYFIKPAWCVKADTPFVAAIIAKHAQRAEAFLRTIGKWEEAP